MPQAVAPREIEQSDFLSGWAPDFEDMSFPPNAIVRVKNLLPNPGDGTLVTRKGFKRLPGLTELAGYDIKTIHPYNYLDDDTSTSYLIIVGSKPTAAVGNQKIVAYNLDDDTETVVVDDIEWTSHGGIHYGFVVNNTFYGGTEKDPMYSWHPVNGFEPDVSSHNYDEFEPTKAYDDGDKVFFTYSAVDYEFKVKEGAGILRGTRKFPVTKWVSGDVYTRGDRVRVKVGANSFFTVFRCTEKHTADADNKPGTDTTGKWKKVKLDPPKDDDGNTNTETWDEVLDAPITKLAVWWAGANRPYFRPDNQNEQAVMYGHMVDPETLEWDPTDYTSGTKRRGIETVAAAGRIPFPSGEGDRLTAFLPFGSNLLVFSEKKCYAIVGENPESQYRREIAPVGCIGLNALCEHDGFVYFMSDEGLFVTDATEVIPMPGAEKVTKWLSAMMRWEGNLDRVQMWSADGFVWMSFPTGKGNTPDRTLVYEPKSQSFWKVDFAPNAVAVNRKDGQDRVFFSLESENSSHVGATYAWTGTPDRTSSTRTISATTVTNQFRNPNFESRDSDHLPNDWTATSASAQAKVTKDAARRGNKGVQVTNTRAEGNGTYEGITQIVSQVDTTTHEMFIYCRRPNWQKNDSAPPVKARIASTDFSPTFEKIGRGWFKAVYQFAGSISPRATGWVVKANRTVEFDQAFTAKGTDHTYFDGDAGAGTTHKERGSDRGLVYQYGRVQDANGDVVDIYTDDEGKASYSAKDIGWSIRTAWFPFGMFREERRIRRVWVLVRGSVTTIVRAFSNYTPKIVAETDAIPNEDDTVKYLEGMVGDIPASYAIQFGIEGESAPASFQGVGVDTQVVRVGRFGT